MVLPDLLDAGLNAKFERFLAHVGARAGVECPQALALVGQHHAIDRERVRAGDFQQLCGAVKWKRQSHLRLSQWLIGLSVLGDESAADGEERALGQDCAVCIEGREPHAIGVFGAGAGRKHLIAMEEEVVGLVEVNRALSRKIDAPGSTDGGDRGFNGGWIDLRPARFPARPSRTARSVA